MPKFGEGSSLSIPLQTYYLILTSLQLYNFTTKTFLMNDAQHVYCIITTLQLRNQNFFIE